MGARQKMRLVDLSNANVDEIDWSTFRQRGHEFQEIQASRPLPDDLWYGPDPGLVAEDNVSGGVTVAGGSKMSPSLMNTLPEPWRSLVYAVQRKGNFIPLFGTVGTQPLLIRPAEERTYLILQNTSTANTLFVGFGYAPVIATGGATGLQLNAGGGAFEPAVIPSQDIWVVGSAASTQWVLFVSQG